MSKNAVATVASTALVAAGDLDVFAEFAGQGFENVGIADLIVPRLEIIQSNSPQTKRNKADYIDGAKEGSVFDTGTGELMPAETEFLPVYYRKRWLEWMPRSSGGGLVFAHETAAVLEQTRPNEKGKPVLANGNEIVETAEVFGLNLSANGRPCFLAFKSTQLKKVKRWLTLANSERIEVAGRLVQPPLFYRAYTLTTAMEDNKHGSWAGWVITRGAPLHERPHWRDLMARAVDLRVSLQKGTVQADTTTFDEGVSSADVPM